MNQTRRQFLQTTAALAASYPLASIANKAGMRTIRPRAKSIIQIWMWGGPSHLDTFDPKPEAGQDYCGSLRVPLQTNVSGLRISEQLPMLAKQADKYSIIRSMTHGVNAHETASYLMQTGRHVKGKRVYPSIGSVISMMKGYDNGYKCSIPPYVVLTTSQGRFSKSGFLGSQYKPFITGGDPNRDPFLVDGYVIEGVDKKRQMKRRNLLDTFNTFGGMEDPMVAQIEQNRSNAYKQIFAEDLKVFNLSEESTKMRERYGRTWFGQACLMARRLVEKGVPYITINYPGWDTHKRHFQTIGNEHRNMDRGLATLLQDLSEQGLLDQTIVWWGGEFGRTPQIQWGAPWNGGRSHWGKCFSTVVAGGGFKGGNVVGASDRRGEEVAERPVHPQDLLGSFYELMGINPDERMNNPQNLDVTFAEKASSYGRLHEIMKL